MHQAMKLRMRGVVVALWHAAERATQWIKDARPRSKSHVAGPTGRTAFLSVLVTNVNGNVRLRNTVAALVFEVDSFRELEEILCRDAQDELLQTIAARTNDLLRQNDALVRLEGPRFGLALSPRRRLDLESAIRLSIQIQQCLAEPLHVASRGHAITVSVGFALASRVEEPTAEAMLNAACTAQIEALKAGPNAIRSYSTAMANRVEQRKDLANDIDQAFTRGQICAYFQPQQRLSDGHVTGFEALARWDHPTRGMISPAEFLPVLVQAGRMGKLAHKMLTDSLGALSQWDADGFDVPQISINLSKAELRNPAFVDQVNMELDRFELNAQRLVIEVLETVVASRADDLIVTNLRRLAELGCHIDLDDFGTGHASITSIRQFSISRIKIDRSFITDLDKDPEQKSMVEAILTMADRLGLQTLAEGVETPEELKVLSAIGCNHIQGFVLARPMPEKEAGEWLILQSVQNPKNKTMHSL